MRTAGVRCGLVGGLILLLALWPAPGDGADSSAPETRLPVEEFVLANGMRFLLLERPAMPTIEAGWVVAAGAADDPAGATGISHFIEHMLFKGSRSIGSRDIERELAVLERLGEAERALGPLSSAELEAAGKRRAARRHADLEQERAALAAEARGLGQLGAFSLEYSRSGASRLNANTAEDLTLYYVTLPAETLELWFWLESDRLLEPVFREFSKEKQVVAEERRRRIDSTPTGAADLEFETAFWQGVPYSQPPLGRPEHLSKLTRAQLGEFFARHYRPGALTAVLVGNFDAGRVKELARSYFGRLESRSPRNVAAPAFSWTPSRSREELLDQVCMCPPQVRIRYPTVPFGHTDQFALQALAGLLNGRTGRLYRNLVLGREIAFSGFAQQTPLRRAGSFTVTLEAKGEVTGEALLAAWDEELARLADQPAAANELARVRRRLATENLDQLKDPHLLMRRLLVYAGLGDWRQLAGWTERIEAVQPDAVMAVARRYLTPDRRLVGYYRRPGAGD